jgi:ATP-binding cassette, subfamily B, bacterial
MMSTYYGIPRTVAQCRAVCASEDDDLTTDHLIAAARMIGLSATDWVIEGANSFDACLSLPAIVNWHGRYFVVVERVTPQYVILVDPTVGRRRLARELFDRFCSGAAVTFTRARGLPGQVASLVRDAFHVPESRSLVGLLIASTLALQICSLALPAGLLMIVDEVLPLGVKPSLWWVLMTMALVVMAHVILRYVRSEALVQLGMSVEARWRHRAGVDGLNGDLVSQPIVACLHAWFVMFSLFVVALWSLVLAAVGAGFCLVQVCVVAWASGRLRLGIEKEVVGMEFSATRRSLGSMVDGLVSGVGFCSSLVLLVLGAHEVLAGRLTIAGMLAMNVIAAGALIPVGEMTRGVQRFLIARARFERLCGAFDVVDEGRVGS